MRTITCCLSAVITMLAASASAQAPAQPRYLMPPKEIVDVLDAPGLPLVVTSPDRQTIAVFDRRSMPGIAEVSQPMYRLAGRRLNPRTNGPHRLPGLSGVSLQPVGGGTARKVALPAGANLLTIGFSPDGTKLAFANVGERGIDLWMVDVKTAQARAISPPALNASLGSPCEWLDSNRELVCAFVPAARGGEPKAPAVPVGPNIQENIGKPPAPVATYQDLLDTTHDEALFEHYFTSQLEYVDAATGKRQPVGTPGIMDEFSPSPDGRFLLVARVKRPFSRQVPVDDFARDVQILDRAGKVVRAVADLPVAENVPINGVLPGPRSYRWNTSAPATVVWVEALDGGDPRRKVTPRDRVVALAAPFAGEPTELLKTEFRFRRVAWTEKGVAFVTEFDRQTRWTRTWLLDAPGAAPRKLWDRHDEDRYKDPGLPLTTDGAMPTFGNAAAGPIQQRGDAVFLRGEGASTQGDRPFLDRLDLKTLRVDRVFQSDDQSYEMPLAVLSDDGRKLLTRRETRTQPPNVLLRDLASDEKTTLVTLADPYPKLTAALANREFVTYERKDGVKLSGTIYLPTNYKKGERVPLYVWAYPREFADPGAASQIVGSPNRFTIVNGASHLVLLTQGYAIFDGPTMPIVGEGETANDTYVEQLVASAQAAVDKAVEMGIADRDRVGVGGHSYGGFMTANLLAHSDIFRAGTARSAAYNRTLTPFGFQNERRTFWEKPEIYGRMSPFFYADKINEPILLIHGEMDDNSGTFPIQSERLYMALKGHGATVRYVTLPYEAHGYQARESILHTVAEMLNWMNTYVKDAGPRPTTTAAR